MNKHIFMTTDYTCSKTVYSQHICCCNSQLISDLSATFRSCNTLFNLNIMEFPISIYPIYIAVNVF